MILLADLLAFQLSWLAAALWRDAATGLVLTLVLLRLGLSDQPLADARAGLIGLAFGGFTELLLGQVLGLRYDSDWALPLWMLALWFLLGIAARHSMRWIARLPWAAAISLGALGGWASYRAAESLGALAFETEPALAGLGLAAIWGLVLPMMSRSVQWQR